MKKKNCQKYPFQNHLDVIKCTVAKGKTEKNKQRAKKER